MPGVNVRGTRLIIPQAVSIIEDTDMAGINLRSSGIVALLGNADGGEPQKVHYVTSLEQARAIFKSGNLVEAVRLALSPSSDTPGAALIACIRVEAATQAAHTFHKSTDHEVTVTSWDWGLHCNTISVKLDWDTDHFDVGIRYGNLEQLGTFNAKGFTIQYVGDGSACVMTISATGLTTTCTGASSDDLDIDWGTFATIEDLVAFIDNHAKYTCTLNHAQATGDPEQMLDYVTDQAIKASAYAAMTCAYDVTRWFNDYSGGLVTAVQDGHGKPDDTSPTWTFLTGGTNPAAVTQDWTDGLTLLEGEDVQIVVAYTSTSAVHALVQTHVETMSNMTNKKERIGILGSEEDDSAATAIADAATYNSPRMVYVYPGLYQYDTLGNLVLYPGWKVAAQIAGMLAGVDVATALTHRYLTARGVETTLSPSDQESLLLGGVLPIVYVRGRGYRIVQSITTWAGDDNFVRREISCRRAADYVVRNIREELEEGLLGNKGGPQVLARAVSITESMLNMMVRQQIIVGDESSPAYRNVTATISQDVLTVSFECNLVVPVNYIVLVATMRMYEGTVTA